MSFGILAACAALAIGSSSVGVAETTPPPNTEYVTVINNWVTPQDGTSTDMMFATLEAHGYSTANLSMGHDLSQCGPGAAGCALFAPDGTEYIIIDPAYVGTQVGLFVLVHEYWHATRDLRSETLAVDECNADRFAEAIVPTVQGAYTMCDTDGVPFPGADYHPPINFVAR